MVLTVKFAGPDADLRCLERFVSGIHGEIRLVRLRLTPVGVIDTVWRTDIAVFGLCDAATWCQCCRVVSMVGFGMKSRFESVA